MSQFTWPPVSFSGNSNPSVGVNGAAIPTDSTQVAGSDGTNLRPLKVGTDGTQYVFVSGSATVAGTVAVSSGTINQIGAGTINQVGTVSLVSSGTINQIGGGTINQVGTVALVSSLASGTVTLASATVAVSSGTISQISAGTISQLVAGTISQISAGTVTLNGSPLVTIAAGTSAIGNVGTVSLLSAGTVAINTGTLSNLASGTVTLASATIASVSAGTVTISGTPNVGSVLTTPAAGTVSMVAVAVGTAAVLLVASGTVTNPLRTLLIATPDASSTGKFYIGNSSVANSGNNRGVQIVGGQSFILNNDASSYYIISDTVSQTVYVMETVK
jgi:hypothetical protein